MNILQRLITRIRFRRTIKNDESTNVVDGIVRARKLYKELCVLAHPDKHPSNRDTAQDLMQRITENRHNYAALLSIKTEIAEKLK